MDGDHDISHIPPEYLFRSLPQNGLLGKMHWKKLTHVEIDKRIKQALEENMDYRKTDILGVPASYLDEEQFYTDAPFLEDAPYLRTFIANPNHIGCHTRTHGESEPFFKGTQKLEVELIRLCAEQILEGNENAQDGYVAPGGTEANMQAVWIYRNYFQREFGAKHHEIALVYSRDSHYSLPKASNLLNVQSIVVDTDDETREIDLADLDRQISGAIDNGVKYFILFQNLSTTMFGSVDDIEAVSDYFENRELNYKLHVDGAFGGFIFPFVKENSPFTFKNPRVSSFTLDGHKMLQTPYGTGIFLVRKGMMEYVETEEAQYVHGKDFTICGSRSGANAVSVWMTLMHHGSQGWKYKMEQLLDRTEWICQKLDQLGMEYFRNPHINIIAIRAESIPERIAKKYHLVADKPGEQTRWWKIVVMPHVRQGVLDNFIDELKKSRATWTES